MILDITVRPWLTKYLVNPYEPINHVLENNGQVGTQNPLKKQREFYESVDLRLEFENSITLEMILQQLHIPSDECGIVIYNHAKISLEDIITEDGTIRIYPPIIGG